MKKLKGAITIFAEVLTVALSLAVLTVGSSRFERVLLACTVEVFCLLRGLGLMLTQMMTASNRDQLVRFSALAQMIGRKAPEWVDYQAKEAADLADSRALPGLVGLVGTVIVSFCATAALIMALTG